MDTVAPGRTAGERASRRAASLWLIYAPETVFCAGVVKRKDRPKFTLLCLWKRVTTAISRGHVTEFKFKGNRDGFGLRLMRTLGPSGARVARAALHTLVIKYVFDNTGEAVPWN